MRALRILRQNGRLIALPKKKRSAPFSAVEFNPSLLFVRMIKEKKNVTQSRFTLVFFVTTVFREPQQERHNLLTVLYFWNFFERQNNLANFVDLQFKLWSDFLLQKISGIEKKKIYKFSVVIFLFIWECYLTLFFLIEISSKDNKTTSDQNVTLSLSLY